MSTMHKQDQCGELSTGENDQGSLRGIVRPRAGQTPGHSCVLTRVESGIRKRSMRINMCVRVNAIAPGT